jgi:pyruvate-formate lyase-activating enzyme
MLPSVVQWEITYACPLRCSHCYSESGVRPSRQLPREELFRLTDVLCAMKPRVVHVSGGEPVLIKELPEVARRLRAAGISVVLTTSGFGVDEERARALAGAFHSIHVSVDGADEPTHDRIRGRAGSFAAATAALAHLDQLSQARRRERGAPLRFGIDFVVLRSTFDQLRRLLTDVASRFGELEYVIFNAVVPLGLASREGYDRELLTDEQLGAIRDPGFAESLQALAPPGVLVELRDNVDLQLHPDLVAEGAAWTLDRLVVEPDGQVRALGAYEGQVGSLLDEPVDVLWQRALARRADPLVVETLSQVRTSSDWAAAARTLDVAFASPRELVRIRNRKPYPV